MKFPRNARITGSRLDAAPWAAVFFLLVIFLMLGSLIYTPGVALQLPVADELPGTERPTLSVAIDGNGCLYYENQRIDEKQLLTELHTAAARFSEPPTLLVHADKKATTEMLVQLTMLARQAGITNGLLATLPRPVAAPTPAPSSAPAP